MISRTVLLLLAILVGSIYAEKTSPRIIIIGAGASGIAAASKLLENNFDDVLILEAEDRIGGRIYTKEFDGYSVDLGAQWVHGEKGNIAYDLAAPLELIEHSSTETYHPDIYASTGELLDPSISQNFSDFFMQTFDDSDNITEDYNGSAAEYFEEQFKGYFAEHPEINETLQEQLLWSMSLYLTTADAAENWNDIALEAELGYKVCEGDQAMNWKERGYSTILDILMKKIPNPKEELPVWNKTILNTEVTKIDYTSEDGTVKVSTLDGKEYVADHVIVTTSLGVLKAQHETLFDPPLPEAKVNTIDGLAFGTVCKVYLAFNETWWEGRENERSGFTLLWSEEMRKEYENDPKKSWLPGTLGYFFVQYKPRLLLVWISGNGARLVEDIPDEDVLNGVMHTLRQFVGNDYNITEPVGMLRSHWYKNKHFRGTYTYRSMETKEKKVMVDGLLEPIVKSGKPVVLFGGEATDKDHYSTVQGAIEAGIREAKRIIELHNESNDEDKNKTE